MTLDTLARDVTSAASPIAQMEILQEAAEAPQTNSPRDQGEPDPATVAKLLKALLPLLVKDNFEHIFKNSSDPLLRSAHSLFNDLVRDTSWIDPRLTDFVEKCAHVSKLTPQEVIQQPLSVDNRFGQNIRFKGRVPVSPGELLEVSSIRTNFVPILDDNLTDPNYCQHILDRFISRLSNSIREHNITRLCFVEKELGPVGALSMMSAMVAQTGIPACIYREPQKSLEASICRERPSSNDRVCIVYDLAVSGLGIQSVAKKLRSFTGAAVPSAAVFFNYNPGKDISKTWSNADTIIEALVDRHDLPFDIIMRPNTEDVPLNDRKVTPSGVLDAVTRDAIRRNASVSELKAKVQASATETSPTLRALTDRVRERAMKVAKLSPQHK